MALQAPTGSHLLAAMLSLSAIHRKHAGVDQSEDLVAYLRYQSVKRLKLPVIGQSREADDIAMATTLMLCLSEIMSGGEKPNSWRLHLQGVAAIQRGMDEAYQNNPNAVETPIRSFLRRWSVALEVLALLCGTPMSESDVRFVLHVAKPDGGDHYIDEFHGFTTKLVPVFGKINLMSIELNSNQAPGQTLTPSEPAASPGIRKRCFVLVKYIESMINEKNHKFHPAIQSSITPTDRSCFTHLNEAYHHVALLQIYVRILNLPSYAPIVQLSVKRTIYCISNMNLSLEACPAVAILQPVFTAGCEACEIGDREAVLGYLGTLEGAYGMGNVGIARAFLKELWVQRDARQERNVRLRWDEFMRKYS
jgi:Fungal specific transcription factor domain